MKYKIEMVVARDGDQLLGQFGESQIWYPIKDCDFCKAQGIIHEGRKNIVVKNAWAQGMSGILVYVQTINYQRRCELDKLVEAMRAKFLKQEIELLKAQVEDRGTGHIRTAISVLERQLKELED